MARSEARLLVVGPRAEERRSCERLLEGVGGAVVGAASGEEALQILLQGSPFAAVILDFELREPDGFATAQRIRERAPNREIPIIFVSDHDMDPAQLSRAYALGAVDCLRKPVQEEVLRAKVSFYVDVFERTQLAQVFEGALDAVVLIDEEGIIRDWNPQAELVFGWPREEAVGRPLADTIIPPRYRAAHLEGMERLRTTGEGRILGKRLELAALRKDGSEFPIELAVTQSRLRGGRKFCAFIRDVTERRRAEDEIRRLNQELEKNVEERSGSLQEVTRELDTFAYTVAHDLRAPLRAMQGFSEILLLAHAPGLSEGGRDLLRRISDSGKRMDHLIQDLLAYSRLSLQAVPMEEAELSSVVDDARKALGSELQRMRIEIQQPLPLVRCHPVTLRQAIKNLLENAAKFVSPDRDPKIRVWAEPHGEHTRLWIEDNGIGIPPEHLGNLFRPFHRLHLKEAYPGTGIGLAIVRRALERMGGRAGVESEVGIGSRFWIEVRNPT